MRRLVTAASRATTRDDERDADHSGRPHGEGTHQRLHLLRRRTAPASVEQAQTPQREKPQGAADHRPAEAEQEKVGLELRRDVGALRAHEMEDLDHVRVAGHRRAGGEDDDEHRRRQHQGQHRRADEDGGPRHRHETRYPDAVVVQARFRQGRLKPRGKVGEVRHGAGPDGQPHQARHGQLAHVEAGAQPGFEQGGGFGVAHHRGGLDAGRGARELHGFGERRVHVEITRGTDLHRRLARHVGRPGVGPVGNHGDRAERQGGQRRHDGDHEDERTARHRTARHDRCRPAALLVLAHP